MIITRMISTKEEGQEVTFVTDMYMATLLSQIGRKAETDLCGLE
jgi:hypothetical protein